MNSPSSPAAPIGRILLVDDSDAVTKCIKNYLEIYGHSVAEENSPFKAVQTALNEKPDLIVLDIKMPGRDGGDVLQGIQAEAELREVPVVFLTGLMTVEETGDGLERGGQFYLSKQAKFSVLLKLINRLLSERMASSQAST